VTSVTTPDPDGAGSQTASVTSYAYDRQNHVTSITDPRNGVTAFTYDAIGRRIEAEYRQLEAVLPLRFAVTVRRVAAKAAEDRYDVVLEVQRPLG